MVVGCRRTLALYPVHPLYDVVTKSVNRSIVLLDLSTIFTFRG